MDKNQICRLIEEATKTLTPTSVKVAYISDESIRISIISEAFNGIPLTKRFKALQDLLEAHTPKLVEKYLVVFDALSKAESDALDEAESKKDILAPKGRDQAAAQPSQ